ncbi:uncharacterized protein LOC125530004 [Triticum urartu]|uniref:uncharacterized protein LOC125530004 n=1 Tax=Triticum urartu TaxID=4572 RepID=UPI00204393A2|nr:uncharacterized protein LOC125530004 [Triticum urartu]
MCRPQAIDADADEDGPDVAGTWVDDVLDMDTIESHEQRQPPLFDLNEVMDIHEDELAEGGDVASVVHQAQQGPNPVDGAAVATDQGDSVLDGVEQTDVWLQTQSFKVHLNLSPRQPRNMIWTECLVMVIIHLSGNSWKLLRRSQVLNSIRGTKHSSFSPHMPGVWVLR